MNNIRMSLAVAVAVFAAVPAFGDWNSADPYKMHFPQFPDLVQGMNVLAMDPLVLADDFRCTSTGPITGIHIWGSWLNDGYPVDATGVADPGLVGFHLSLHADIPDPDPTDPTSYSQPGAELWAMDFAPGTFSWRDWATSTERFYDPAAGAVMGTDTRVLQYNFAIDPSDAYVQQAGTVYWLDVTAIPVQPDPLFGWKTSADHWNDDSVYASYPGPPAWKELIDPDYGFSLDQAFVIVPEPATVGLLALGGLAALLRRRRRLLAGLAPMLLAGLLTVPLSAAPLTLTSGLGLTHGGNLVVNGSFENQASGTTYHYWATGTTLTPYEAIDNWSSLGGPDAYANRGDIYSNSGTDTIPDGAYGVYFGNSFVSSISETPTFLANGRVQFTSPPTITPGTGYSPPVQLWQSLSGLNTGHKYGLSFWVSGEASRYPTFQQDGLFALDVTGFDREYLAIPCNFSPLGISHVYEFTFVPSASNVTVRFTNWGHFAGNGGTAGWTLPDTTELALDDVIVNDLGPVPEPATASLLIPAGLALLRKRSDRTE